MNAMKSGSVNFSFRLDISATPATPPSNFR
jgi:hypothetical protein